MAGIPGYFSFIALGEVFDSAAEMRGNRAFIKTKHSGDFLIAEFAEKLQPDYFLAAGREGLKQIAQMNKLLFADNGLVGRQVVAGDVRHVVNREQVVALAIKLADVVMGDTEYPGGE